MSNNQTRNIRDVVENLSRLLALGEWIGARDLPYSRRVLRLAAQHSHGHIISGNAGYRLATAATPAERLECAARLTAQICAMQRRVDDILAVHSALAEPPSKSVAVTSSAAVDGEQVSGEEALTVNPSTSAPSLSGGEQ